MSSQFRRAFRRAVFAVALACSALSANADSLTCEGEFPNPITAYCWSCVYPIRLFGQDLLKRGGEDFDTGFNNAFCFCKSPPQVGVPTSFWEMVYMTDVTTVPWCFPLLGGVRLNAGINDNKVGMTSHKETAGIGPLSRSTFRWVHGYTNPLMYVLDVLLDAGCLTKGSISPAWPAEVDPAYDDWELSNTMNPISFAVANMAGIAAGTVDAVAALVDFPRPELFWTAGAWGSIYPYTGWVYPHVSNDATSRLLSTRMLAWQHEFKSMAAHYGEDASCSQAGYWQPIMDKRQYKFQRLWPVPQTKKIDGTCCGPIGRSTLLAEEGVEVPSGKYRDFGYGIFRKRDCCSGAWP